MPRCWTSSANSVGVQCVTERPLSAGGSQATASSWAICSAVNLPGHPGRGKSLNNSSRARGKAAAFSQHSIRTRRWNAAAQRRRQMPTACRSQPRWSAIAWLSQPPNASKIMWARWARACGQVLERVRVCRTSCWRSVIMTLAALPGMARTSPSVGEIGGLGKYRKTRAIVEASFSQGVLGPISRNHGPSALRHIDRCKLRRQIDFGVQVRRPSSSPCVGICSLLPRRASVMLKNAKLQERVMGSRVP